MSTFLCLKLKIDFRKWKGLLLFSSQYEVTTSLYGDVEDKTRIPKFVEAVLSQVSLKTWKL